MKINKFYLNLIGLILFPFLIWGIFGFYSTFIGFSDFFGFGGFLTAIAVTPIIFVSCIAFAVYFAKKNKQSIILSIVIVLLGFLVAPSIAGPFFSGTREGINDMAQRGLETNDPSLCQLQIKLSKSYTEKKPGNECLVQLASNNNDISICNLIKSGEFKFDCYRDLAYKNNDASLCEKITGILREESYIREEIYTEFTDACYRDIAINTNDLTLCLKIKDEKTRLRCSYSDIDIAELAQKGLDTNDPSLCQLQIKLATYEESIDGQRCLYTLAQYNNDISICDLINDDSSYKANCYAQVDYNAKICNTQPEEEKEQCLEAFRKHLEDIRKY